MKTQNIPNEMYANSNLSILVMLNGIFLLSIYQQLNMKKTTTCKLLKYKGLYITTKNKYMNTRIINFQETTNVICVNEVMMSMLTRRIM